MSLRQYFPLGASASMGTGLSINHKVLFKYTPTAGATVTFGPAVVTATFGTGPYTYAWSISDPDITITSPTSNSTTFSYTGSGAASSADATAVCKVTDSLAATESISCNVSVQVGGELT